MKLILFVPALNVAFAAATDRTGAPPYMLTRRTRQAASRWTAIPAGVHLSTVHIRQPEGNVELGDMDI
jgi:hypothetical protein